MFGAAAPTAFQIQYGHAHIGDDLFVAVEERAPITLAAPPWMDDRPVLTLMPLSPWQMLLPPERFWRQTWRTVHAWITRTWRRLQSWYGGPRFWI